MKFAVGCDIEKISRFSDKIHDDKFLRKIFTETEIEYCRKKASPEHSFAARFCGKEAVVKALHSLGIKNVYYKDVEIANSSIGVPLVNLKKELKTMLNIEISLSHCDDYAMANALVYC